MTRVSSACVAVELAEIDVPRSVSTCVSRLSSVVIRCDSVISRSLSWLIRTNKESSAVDTILATYPESTPAVVKAASSVVMSAASISIALSAL